MKNIFYVFIILTISFKIFSSDVEINFSKENNLRQSYNDCAIFSIKAVIKILNKKDQKIENIKDEIKERLPNNYTLPWGIENYLKKNKIKINVINFSILNDNQKTLKLREILFKKRPIILLIGIGKYQHYITLLGYNDKYFFIYDSIYKTDVNDKKYTVDDNSKMPGNRNILYNELMKLWNNGGMYGLYKNYGIECYN